MAFERESIERKWVRMVEGTERSWKCVKVESDGEVADCEVTAASESGCTSTKLDVEDK